MMDLDAVLQRIRLEYKRVSQFLTVIEIHFDGYLKSGGDRDKDKDRC